MNEHCVLCGVLLNNGHYGYCTSCWRMATGITITGTFTPEGATDMWLISGGMDMFKNEFRNQQRRKHNFELTFSDLPPTFFVVSHIELSDGTLVETHPTKVPKSPHCS